ncbi:targeting protein for Xklp2 homolog [Diadema antillarum]|uniref:targeting protein for Xklp2 homolog n=1 Tax=Diadema antillarum TaxID=105358 RepID=UPI003A87D0D4
MEERPQLDDKYEYNCPQFVDFSMPQTNDDRADEYFDFDHESGQPITFGDEPDTEIPQDFQEPSEPEKDTATHADDIHSTEDEITCERVLSPAQECPVSAERVEPSGEMTRDQGHARHQVDERVGNLEAETPLQTAEPAVTTDVGGADDATGVERIEDRETEECKEHAPAKQVPEVRKETAGVVDSGETVSNEDSREQDVRTEDSRDAVMAVVDELPAEAGGQSETMEALPVESADHDQEMTQAPCEPMQDDVQKMEATEQHSESHHSEPEKEVASSQSKIPSNLVTNFEPTAPLARPAPKNMVTSWGARNDHDGGEPVNRQMETKETKSRPTTRRSTRSLNNDSNLRRSAGNMQRRSLRLKSRSSESPANKRRRVSEQSRGQGSAKKAKPAAPAPAPAKPFVPKLTMPTTPTVMKRNNIKPGAQFKSTEQLEMERIADFRKQLAERKKQSQASYKKVQGSSAYQPLKAVIAPTKPEAFNFETDQRIKQHPMATRQDAKSFQDNLRKGRSSPIPAQRGPTVPKPFKLTENRKRKLDNAEAAGVKSSPYVSMATRINQFQTKTPQRYHTRRSGEQQKDTSLRQEAVQKPKLTCPKTPNLESRTRKRPITVQSAVEKEEQEVMEMQSYKFKAKPVNPRVLSNLNVGIKIVSHKEPTKPVGFSLESERRMKERESKREEQKQEEEPYEFHAHPVSSKMLEGPTGLGPSLKRPLTCPKSPAFALKNRVRVKEDSAPEPEEHHSHVIHANPIVHVGVPFRPQLSHKMTEAQPFSFEKRDKEMMARKEAKIQEIYKEEEKARQFKAKPILEKVSMPEKKVKPTTKLEPFSLSMEDQGAKKAEIWSKKMEEELNEQRAMASAFKAKSAEVIYKEPFIPQKPNKPLTEISEFTLNTDRRAVEREQYEQCRLRKELELRENMHQQKLLQEEEERREIERMRREEMVHKANPVRHFKAVHIVPSDRPLTEACSPHFSDRFQK